MPSINTIDLRGSTATPAPQGSVVLADPTGRRARRMRLTGRLLATLFAAWLLALALTGLGLLPSGTVPLANAITARPVPPTLARENPLVARAGAPPALASPGSDNPVAVVAPDGTTRASGPTDGKAPARKRKRPATPKRPSTAVVPAATAKPKNPKSQAQNPRPTATAKPSPGGSGSAPGRTHTPAGRASPTPTAAPSPEPTPKPRGRSGTSRN